MMRSDSSARGRRERETALVGFHVGDGYYAVPVPMVREIVSPTSLVSVPHASSIVLGVTDHRGQVIPVVDLRRRFGLPPPPPGRRSKWIIVEGGNQWLGLVVDSVSEVFAVNASHTRVAPKLGPNDVAQGFSAVYVYDEQLVLVLDLAILLRAVTEGAGAISPPSWKPPALPKPVTSRPAGEP